MYPTGVSFREYKSTKTVFGLPFMHYAYGKSPETGKRVVAKGILAIGRIACGVIAIGQASFGVIAIGQLAIGILFGLGQATTGIAAIGQLVLGVAFGLGQFSTGIIAIGQFASGKYVLAQVGFGKYVWSPKYADPIAVEFFRFLWPK